MVPRPRRSVLQAILVSLGGVGAGCSTDLVGERSTPTSSKTTPSEHVTDVEVVNKTTRAVTVSLNVVINGSETLDETFSLNSGDGDEATRKFAEVVGGETAKISVSVEEGPEDTIKFSDEPKTDATGLLIDIHADRIEFQKHAA